MVFGVRSLYTPVRGAESWPESDESLPEQTQSKDEPFECRCREHGTRRPGRMSTARFAVLALTLFGATVISVLLFSTLHKPTASTKDCVEKLYAYTPATDAIEYYDTDFENVFAQKSIYRGPPTEEREKAWLGLWKHPGIMIPPHGLALLNRSGTMDRYVKVRPEMGDGYVALLETFHQLHCLDIIRQYTWWLMKKYPEDRIPPDLTTGDKGNRMHVDHCIETLRLNLMCQADATPLLVLKDPGSRLGTKADFNTHHRCRNFTKLLDWSVAHGVEDGKKDGDLHDHHP